MQRIVFIFALAIAAFGCATPQVTDATVQDAARSVDFGDYSSATLVGKAWQALEDKDYPRLLAYTQKCEELHGETGKKMNAALTDFEPEPTASMLWALNDVGTCLYIMANAYVELERYQEASAAYRRLADDFSYAQCWDPKGWFWHPAATAALQAEKYKNW